MGAEGSRVRGPGGLLCHRAGGLKFCGNGASFWVVMAAWNITYPEV